MAEYIDRQAAIKKLDHFQSHLHTVEGTHAIGVAKTLIEEIPATDVRPTVQREAVMQALSEFFTIGDSYTYELNRVKEAFYIGTMTLEDFEEWNEDNVSELCDYLMKKLFCPNCGADMREES